MILFGVREIVVLAVALVAVVFDVRTRRIRNWLTFGAALAALAYAAFDAGQSGKGRAERQPVRDAPRGSRARRCFFRFLRSAVWALAT